MNDIRKHATCFIFGSFLLWGSSGCDSSVDPELPGGEEEIGLNFYCASEVLGHQKGTAPIYLDEYTPDIPFNTFMPNPYFVFGTSERQESPALVMASNAAVMYMRHTTGDHRIVFSDTAQQAMVDTVLYFPPQDYHCLYLADEPVPDGHPARYAAVSAREERTGEPGKVKLRLINLSPDAGAYSVALTRRDGSLEFVAALSAIGFKGVSAYAAIDTTGRAMNRQLILNLVDATGVVVLVTGVPAVSESEYSVVLQGFANDTQRQVRVGQNEDGTPRYSLLNIPARISARVRRMY